MGNVLASLWRTLTKLLAVIETNADSLVNISDVGKAMSQSYKDEALHKVELARVETAKQLKLAAK